MTRLLIVAALFCLVVPAALAAPPAGKGKPESSEATTQTVEKNAAKKCKAERDSIGVDAFKTKHGTNANKANAFGKCVSGKAKKLAESAAEANAAKKCKAERDSIGVDAFKTKHGTNPNKANAFGKCVSKLAKAQGASS